MTNHSDILARHHANTHLALAVGGAQRYATIADEEYKDATQFFERTLRQAHSYSTGGSSYREYWTTAHSQGGSVVSSTDPFAGHDNEESCTTYNYLKILRHLFKWSADATFLNMYNYALNNGVLGIQWGPDKPGVMIYLLPLGTGVTKGNSSRSWGTPLNSFWCCYGTGVESFAKLEDSIYFRMMDTTGGLAVGRYVTSTLRYTDPNAKSVLHLHQTANKSRGFAKLSVVDVVGAASVTMTLRLNIPRWALHPTVSLNSKPVAATITPDGFLTIPSRQWAVHDTVVIRLPAIVTLKKLDDNTGSFAGLYSFVFGDTLLVGIERTLGAPNTLSILGLNTSDWVTQDTSAHGPELRFVANAKNRRVDLMPLNEVVTEIYTTYYNVTIN